MLRYHLGLIIGEKPVGFMTWMTAHGKQQHLARAAPLSRQDERSGVTRQPGQRGHSNGSSGRNRPNDTASGPRHSCLYDTLRPRLSSSESTDFTGRLSFRTGRPSDSGCRTRVQTTGVSGSSLYFNPEFGHDLVGEEGQ